MALSNALLSSKTLGLIQLNGKRHAFKLKRGRIARFLCFGKSAESHMASLASLSSKPKAFHYGSSSRLIPLLDPACTGLPFSCSLEIVQRFPSLPGASPLSKTPVNHDVLELLYVMSGNGELSGRHSSEALDTNASPSWPLHSGVSALAWAHSTHITATEPELEGEEKLAVLKFHIPVAMLDPDSRYFGDAEEARSVLNQAGASFSSGQGSFQGFLDPVEAAQLLSHAHKRAHRAFNMYPTSPSSANGATDTTSAEAGSHSSNTVCPASDHALPLTGGHSVSPSTAMSLPVVARSSTSSVPNPNSGSSNSLPFVSSYGSVSSNRGESSDADTTVFVSCNREEPTHVPLLGNVQQGSTSRSQDLAGSNSSSCSCSGSQYPVAGNSSAHDNGAQGPAASSSTDNTVGAQGLGSSSVPQTSQPLFDWHSIIEGRPANESVLLRRAVEDFHAYQFPNQGNRLALAFDPALLGLSFSFGVEVFTPGHVTPLHTHRIGHELFFVLEGKGDAWCDGHHIPVAAGDCIVFPPGTLHGLDNPSTTNKMYTLQMMVPDDSFISFVQSGESLGSLDDEDICTLTASRC